MTCFFIALKKEKNMKYSDIPNYNDPTDFMEDNNKYPCNTQYMVYNPLDHKYYLTEEALNYYGIDVERRYVGSEPNKVKTFLELVTKKVYDYIAYKSGWKCFMMQQYKIAKSTGKMFGHYQFRKEFQNALISQAKFLIENGDSAKFSINNLESGVVDKIKPEDDYMDTGDISNETKRTLNFLGLDRWFTIGQYIRISENDY